jgi:hypothetical protein
VRVGDAVRSRGARVNLLTIDPGADQGWGLFENGLLYTCGLGDPWAGLYTLVHGRPDLLVIECPQVYPRSKKRVDPNRLIVLARRVGRAEDRAELLRIPVELVFPRAWKGTVDGDVMIERIRSRLSAAELALVDGALGPKGKPVAKGKLHNVIDAVGLGLWKLGRL